MTWIRNNQNHKNISYPTQWLDYFSQHKSLNKNKKMEIRLLSSSTKWWIHIDLFSCQSSPLIDQNEFPCCFGCHSPFSSCYHWCQQIAFVTKLKCIIIHIVNNLLAKASGKRKKRRKDENAFLFKKSSSGAHWCCWSSAFININKITSFERIWNAETEDKVTAIQTVVITFDTK